MEVGKGRAVAGRGGLRGAGSRTRGAERAQTRLREISARMRAQWADMVRRRGPQSAGADLADLGRVPE